MTGPTYDKGYICINKSLISPLRSLKTLTKDDHIRRARTIDLIEMASNRRWKPYAAAERFLSTRWGCSLGYPSRLLKRLHRRAQVLIRRKGTREGEPRLLQVFKPDKGRFWMMPRKVLKMAPEQISMAADLFMRAADPDIRHGEMTVTAATLATRWGVSKSTAQRFINHLHHEGLLEIIRTGSRCRPTVIVMAKAKAKQHPQPIPKRPPKPKARGRQTKNAANSQQKLGVRKNIFRLSRHVRENKKPWREANLNTYNIKIIEHIIERYGLRHVVRSLKQCMLSMGFSKKALSRCQLWLIESKEVESGWVIGDDDDNRAATNAGLKTIPRCTNNNLQAMVPFLLKTAL